VIEFREQQVALSALCGLLWNCVDTMPGYAFDICADTVNEPPASRSYAAGARWLKPQLRQRPALKVAK
jgi:hypothetical protein